MSTDYDYGLYYRNFHDESDAHAERMNAWALFEVEEHLLPDKAAPVLDIGCGMGFAIMAMQRRGYTNIRGVDRDPSQVQACIARGLDVDRTEDLLGWLGRREGGGN